MSGNSVEGRKQKETIMKKLLKRLLEKEEGQAFAEYMVLFPGAIMVVIAMAFSLGENLKYRYCEVVDIFSHGLCEIEPFSEPDGSTFCHCEQGEGEGALGRKNCRIARYSPGHADHYWDYWSHDGTCEGWHDLGLPGTPTPTYVPGEPTPTEVIFPTATSVPEQCTVLELTGDCSQCEGDPDCVCLPGINAGTVEIEGVESLVIYAGKEYHIFYTGFTDDGCYYVNIDSEEIWWEKYMHGRDCKKIDHLQAWKVVICPNDDD
jgi:Flp pilus assembly pilin Flp